MVELKRLTKDSIPRALEKAERYRLLNEPAETESICEDVLEIDPHDQRALVTLLLALSDQFDDGVGGHVAAARAILPRLEGAYERAYYTGILVERQAKAHLNSGGPGVTIAVHDGLREAMDHYEQAEALRPTGNDDAVLRWNACARLLMRHTTAAAAPGERFEPLLE